jgi:hypothetical protein
MISDDTIPENMHLNGRATALVSGVLAGDTTIELVLVRYGAHSFAGICSHNYTLEAPPWKKGATTINSAGQLIVNGKARRKTHHKEFRADGTRIKLRYQPAEGNGRLEFWINNEPQPPILQANVGEDMCFCVGGSCTNEVHWQISCHAG